MVDLYELKIAAEKVEMIKDVLASLDEAITLIAAFTQTEENQVLLSKLLDNIDDVKTIVGSVDLIETTTDDINKGTFLGNRKTDIDIALNKIGIAETSNYEEAMTIWNDTSNTVYYNKVTATFVDGTVLEIPFVNDDSNPIQVSTHGAIVDQLSDNVAFTTKLTNTGILEEVGGKTATLIRIIDTTGSASNIERIQLHASAGAFVNATPIYYWALTTSALQTLANRVGDIIALGDDIESIVVLSGRIDELLSVQTNLTELMELHTNLAELLSIDDNTQIVIDKTAITLAAATLAADKATESTNQAEISTTQAQLATTKSDEIKGITAQSSTGAAGTAVSVSYNPVDGKFTFVIPQGLQGIKGEAFDVDAQGTLANRSLFDEQPINFAYVTTDSGELFFKNSSTSGDWGAGIPFGKGDKGDTGDVGNGITTVAKTAGDGSAGSTDTHTITFTDGGTYSFNVYNGLDSNVISVAGRTGAIVLDMTDITGLNTALGLKANKASPIFTGSINEETAVSTDALTPSDGTMQYRTLTADVTLTDGLVNGQWMTVLYTPAGFGITFPTCTWLTDIPTLGTKNEFLFKKVDGVLYVSDVGKVA